MSKANLTFDLTDEDDVEEYHFHSQAKNFYLAIYNFDIHLRSLVKYGVSCTDSKYDVEECLTIEKIRDDLYESLNDHDTSLDLLS
jgi:hypothetical protein